MFFSKDKGSLNLKSKEIKPSEYSFSDALKAVKISGRVRNISVAAFLGCRNLAEVEFCEGVEEIGERAFTNCSSLTRIKLPRSLSKLGASAFKDCTGLEEVYLPDNLEYLPKGAFENCTKLRKIVLPGKLKEIGSECFSGCLSLEEIVFPDTLEKIGNKAFKRCGKLKKLIFPDSLKYIGDFTFDYCRDIEYLDFSGTLDFLGKRPFPERFCENLNVSGRAYVSSFLIPTDEGECPVISVPDGIRFLSLGFDGVLSRGGVNDTRTCYNHILSMNRQGVKLFMSEYYYSYGNDEDHLIEKGRFNFRKYDEQFYKANELEKPFIAAFRLTYNESLGEEYREMYNQSLFGKEKAVAVFVTERNESAVLTYLMENCDFDTDFCTELFNIAMKNGNRNLSDIISLGGKNKGVSQTEDLFGYLLDN